MNPILNSKRILIIAGEASGDIIAADLVKSLKENRNDIEIFGIGSMYMRDAGVNILFDSKHICLMGFDIIFGLRHIIRAYSIINQFIKKNKVDLVVLVDFPDFNLRLLKKLKKYNLKILYYISPQVWAWKKYRIKVIKKHVDKMAVLFRFEEEFYKNHNVKSIFVGHPLSKNVISCNSKEQLIEKYKLDKNKKI